MAGVFVTAEEAARLRGDGSPDIAGYARLLSALEQGHMLRLMLNGEDAASTEERNFRQAAESLGIEVGFGQIFENDNIPYLTVTRDPNALKPHMPGE